MSNVIIRPRGAWAVAEVEPGPVCSACSGGGWTRELDAEGRTGRCACQRVVRRVALWNAAQVPARHATSSFESWQWMGGKDAALPLRQWVEGLDPAGVATGKMLVGDLGVGKTHLAVAALRHGVLERGIAARFVDFGHLLHDMKGKLPTPGRSPAELAATALLVLDDVPVLSTDFERSLADEIITRRYNGAGATIITSNARADTLDAVLGARCASRVREMCPEILLRGLDHRSRVSALRGESS